MTLRDELDLPAQFKDSPTGTPIEAYSYDKTGNRTSFANSAGTQAYVYPADSHRLGSVAGVGRTYDAVGNTTGIGVADAFAYDDAGRMAQTLSGAVVKMNYQYNGKGEQVRRHLGSANTYSLYDEAGRWMGDYDDSGSPKQQVIWLDDAPVGLLVGPATASERLKYIQPDHLGAPRAVIDPIRSVAIWSWPLTSEAFGNSPPNEDPDGDSVDFVFDMRFPGQRYDAASGFNYNYFRDYEPATGRYAQSDPIGLAGGVSTYAYVGGNPISFVDPDGLQRGGVRRFNPNQPTAPPYPTRTYNLNTPPAYYGNGLRPNEVASAENLSMLLAQTGTPDYTQYCRVANCPQKPNQCSVGDIRSSFIPSDPTVGQVQSSGCSCLQSYYQGMPPVQEPQAGPMDFIQMIVDVIFGR